MPRTGRAWHSRWSVLGGFGSGGAAKCNERSPSLEGGCTAVFQRSSVYTGRTSSATRASATFLLRPGEALPTLRRPEIQFHIERLSAKGARTPFTSTLNAGGIDENGRLDPGAARK